MRQTHGFPGEGSSFVLTWALRFKMSRQHGIRNRRQRLCFWGGKEKEKEKKNASGTREKASTATLTAAQEKIQALHPIVHLESVFFSSSSTLIYLLLEQPFLSNMSNFVSLDTGFGTAHLHPDCDFYPSANPLLCGTWNHALPTQTTERHPFPFPQAPVVQGQGGVAHSVAKLNTQRLIPGADITELNKPGGRLGQWIVITSLFFLFFSFPFLNSIGLQRGWTTETEILEE